MNAAVSVGFVFLAIVGACLFVLWFGSSVIIDQLEDRIDVLEARWADTFADEPAEVHVYDEEPATDEIPVQPGIPTEPMALIADPTPAVQARRDAAWDETRPSPVPRGDSDEAKARKAAWVEAELAKIRERIEAAQEAS